MHVLVKHITHCFGVVNIMSGSVNSPSDVKRSLVPFWLTDFEMNDLQK